MNDRVQRPNNRKLLCECKEELYHVTSQKDRQIPLEVQGTGHIEDAGAYVPHVHFVGVCLKWMFDIKYRDPQTII